MQNLDILKQTRKQGPVSQITLAALTQVILGTIINQNDVNVKMGGEDWVDSDNEYISALHVETGECIEAIGYEWWKERVEDRLNTLVELCDIYTFLISHAVVSNQVSTLGQHLEGALMQLDDYREMSKEELDAVARARLRTLTYTTETYSSGEGLGELIETTYLLGFTFEDLIVTYYAKSKLNVFRTANGYKDGNYKKIWNDGREDNYTMMDILMSEEALMLTPQQRIMFTFDKLQKIYLKQNA